MCVLNRCGARLFVCLLKFFGLFFYFFCLICSVFSVTRCIFGNTQCICARFSGRINKNVCKRENSTVLCNTDAHHINRYARIMEEMKRCPNIDTGYLLPSPKISVHLMHRRRINEPTSAAMTDLLTDASKIVQWSYIYIIYLIYRIPSLYHNATTTTTTPQNSAYLSTWSRNILKSCV